MNPSWYKNAVIYSLDVETFYDSNGDGIGDLAGLTEKLDYLSGLGISAIWLLPFYPSPNRDNGYDIKDYYNVDSRLGSLGDFVRFLYKAEQLGIRVIIDLVVNHTSVEHPWFQESRKSRNNPYRNFYIWSDEPIQTDAELTFKGEEPTMWTYDDMTGAYYLHRFYKEQPDLNISNPVVQDEILKIMGFWLKLGVHGFRIDAAVMIVEPMGMKNASRKSLLSFLNRMRSFADSYKKDVLLVGEVNQDIDEMMRFLQPGRMNMLFNFYLNQHLFLSLSAGNRTALEKALKELPPLDASCQWLNFLRHHDELTLSELTPRQQQEVLEVFAPDHAMRIYETGIRRRLAPMMNKNLKWMKLAYSLLFTLPGIPVIRYGDEIAMGDDLKLEGRNAVRTPMQWTPGINGGFSDAPQPALVHPMITKGKYRIDKINVISAQQDDHSLLNWVEKLIITRKQCPEIGYGQLRIESLSSKEVLIHKYESGNQEMIFFHNFSDKSIKISGKKWKRKDQILFDVLGESVQRGQEDLIQLNPYGYRWFRLSKKGFI